METIEDKARWYQRDGDDDGTSATAFGAGAEWMQSEMKAYYEAEIAKYKQDLDESRERENIACKAVAEKREEIARLTKWHDPKEPPKPRKQVLVKTDTGNHDVAYYSEVVDGWIANDGIYNTDQIIGWREIHE